MSFLAGRSTESTGDETRSLAWTAAIAAGLGALFVLLSFVWALPLDVRWYAPLASAWLDLFIVANGARLSGQDRAVRARTASFGLLARTAWRASRRQHGSTAFFVALRSISWQPWGALVSACAALAATAAAWLALPPATLIRALISPAVPIANCAVLLVIAFVTLVAERTCHGQAERSPVLASLARMFRVVLVVTLAAAASSAWLAYAGSAPNWPLRVAAGLTAAIALEFALRAAVLFFLPLASRASMTRVPASAIASVVRWRPSPFAALGNVVRQQYGIDLRQNWVLRSVARLLPAALVSIVIVGWLLTSVSFLSPDQRAVYERFGEPAAVWQPGAHIGLPWPFGKVRLVDNGTVHQLIVSGGADNSSVASPSVHADDSAPDALNRLWDVAHPWETTQVIAGASGDQQNFQIVSADVRLDYRIGASDADARAALYRATDAEGLVRSIANREVVHYLASHTLASLLETRQTAIADVVRANVQRQLDRLGAGIEVVAVVVESIHPPAGAAAAYHGVQAAQVRAQASVAQARAYAATELGDARERATDDVAQAQGDAAETLARARAQQTDFDADVGASQLGGPAYAFEYYLRKLVGGLHDARLTVIDDRLAQGNRATLDLRAYPAGDLAGVAQPNH
ncbi:protease modulator HflK [Trinickia dinghuensis]|uniref:Protease modulator HflK n=1 Tax=Trinickia dinghuensis TaxID=2291023 RepID=A0A3D8JYD0_9BURK|nr:protease modulator HflK [Trinickia dinghuensis]RDU97656.1 protease modulator HflK [Trinickia dinghuensis]